MDVLSYVKSRGNLESLLMSSGTVFAGTAAAVIHGNMEILSASICLLFAIFTQLSANYYYSYSGFRKYKKGIRKSKIEVNESDEMILSERVLKEASRACLIISGMLGLTLMTMSTTPWETLLLGVIIYGLYWISSVDNGRMIATFWGLFSTFLLFGPIGVMGTCLIQAQYEAGEIVWSLYDTAPALILGIGIGFLATNIHLIYSYYNCKLVPEMKRNICRKMGYRITEALVFLNGLLFFGIMTFFIFLLDFPEPLIANLPIVLGFMINCYIAIRMHKAHFSELRHLSMLSLANFFVTSMCLFIVWWIIGSPDDSVKVFF